MEAKVAGGVGALEFVGGAMIERVYDSWCVYFIIEVLEES